jgi:hypothetical protein
MRVSVSLKPTPGATSTLGRNVVVMRDMLRDDLWPTGAEN